MPTCLHFAARAAHYHRLAEAASNGRTAADLYAVSKLFLQMSRDLQTIERAKWKEEFLARHGKNRPIDKPRSRLSKLIEIFQKERDRADPIRRIMKPPRALAWILRDRSGLYPLRPAK